MFSDKEKAAGGAVSAAFNLVLLTVNHSLGCILALIIVIAVTGIIIVVKERRSGKRFMVFAAAALFLFAAAMIISPALRKEFTGFASDFAAIISNTADNSAGHRRMGIWRLTVDYINKKPFFGYGCEGISMKMYSETAISNPHNEILTYAVYYGIPAAICYVLGVLCSIAHSLSQNSSDITARIACMAASGYFLSSLTGVAMFYTIPFFFIFLGLANKKTK